MTGPSCGAHAGIPDDLRATAVQLLERLRAAVEPLATPDGDGRSTAAGAPGACTACPVCALVAVLRGERSDLAARLAEHATGLLSVLVAALEETGEQPPEQHTTNGHRPSGRGRSVQRIVVHRT